MIYLDDLKKFRKLGSYLQGHPDMKHIPGVDMSTGSLGQGLSVANGIAMMSKLDKKGMKKKDTDVCGISILV